MELWFVRNFRRLDYPCYRVASSKRAPRHIIAVQSTVSECTYEDMRVGEFAVITRKLGIQIVEY